MGGDHDLGDLLFMQLLVESSLHGFQSAENANGFPDNVM
jgi:hypothetical protein